ncbi:hypothetical protein K8R61_01230 [bacterium]|nr:hypothetical protein [bacterium]
MISKDELIADIRGFLDEMKEISTRRKDDILHIYQFGNENNFALTFYEKEIMLTMKDEDGKVQIFTKNSLDGVSALKLLCKGLVSFIQLKNE